MVAGADLFFSLFSNLVLFIALVAVYGALTGALPRLRDARRQLLLGLAFGLFALACMRTLIPVAPGVRVDQRNAVVVLSGAFGGPISGLITGAIAAAYRARLGGTGVLGGVTGIGLAALSGAVLHRIASPFHPFRRALVSALLTTLAILPGFALWGTWRQGMALLLSMAGPYGTTAFLAILLGGMLLQREDSHREAEHRFRQLVATSPDGIIVIDRARRIRLINPQARIYGGRTALETLGKPLRELGWLAGELEPRLAAHRGEVERFELQDATGEHVFETVIAPVFSPRRGAEWMVILRDVTARRRAEEARADYEARILQSKSLEALGRLAGGVAHDFNNMLAVILGTTELLRSQRPPGDPVQEDLANITAAASKASDLTAQLLAFGRRQVLEPQVLDPNQVVTALVPLLKRSLPESIELVVSLEAAVSSVLVDAAQLDQVLVNLAVNARDAMPQGGTLTIATTERDLDEEYARAHPGVAPGRYVEISVSDTGVGMAPDVQARVFEPFFTTKERGKGTGLGLATVHGIVSQSGGHLHVYSEPGKGACFRVYFPITKRLAAVASREDHGSTPLTGRVLLVEDSDLVRAPVRRMLTSLGFQVTEASGGNDAIAASLRAPQPFDVLVTDVVMRDLGGAEVAAELRRRDPGIKVLFMSGYTENAIVHDGVLDPGLAFISKPFTLEKLRAALARVLA